tara:strand:+ start:1121 stop:3244 length:2124 start_codon:yes stop_codon:yes gene_type:complete
MKTSLLPAAILFLFYGLLLHWPRPLDISITVDAADVPPLNGGSADFLAELNRHGLRHVPVSDNLAAGLFETMVPGDWSNDDTMPNPVGTAAATATTVALGIELAGSDRQLEIHPIGYNIIFEQPWTPAQIPVAAAWLDRQQAVLNEIQPILNRERYFQYYYSDDGHLISALIPLCSSARAITRAFLARAMRALAQDRLEDAGRDILGVLQLGERLGQGYFSLEPLVGIAIQNEANQAACQWLSHPQLTAQLLANFKTGLATIPAPRPPVQAFDLGERFTSLDISRTVQRQGIAGLTAITGGFHSDFNPLYNLLLSLADWNEVFRLQNDRFDRLVAILKIEKRRQRRVAMDEFRQQMNEELRNGGINLPGFLGMTFGRHGGSLWDASRNIERVLTSVTLPTSIKTIELVDELLLSRQAIETCIAIRQYELENGQYPDTLEILVGNFLSTIPSDIKVEQPLRYRKLEEGVLLYSVGPSGKDNGGWCYPSWDTSRDDRVFLIGKDDRTDREGNPVGRTLFPGEHSYNESGELEQLSFSGRDIEGLAFERISRLSNLRTLDFSSTRISDEDVAILASPGEDGLTNLQTLHLERTAVTDVSLSELGTISSLRNLFLDKTGVTDAGVANLVGLTTLEVLSLNGTQITDEGIRQLKDMANLIVIGLRETEVTDECVKHLKGMTVLKFIVLGSTKVTDAGIADLHKALPNCKISK